MNGTTILYSQGTAFDSIPQSKIKEACLLEELDAVLVNFHKISRPYK